MTSRILLGTLGLAAAAALALTGCGADTPAASSTPAVASTTAAGASMTGPPASSAGTATGPVTLKTASLSLGKILVDSAGKTLYVFDKDTANSGSSACVDKCATVWPALVAGTDATTVDGVTGKVGTITGVDGSQQVTLDGRPLYYFAKDAAAGDVAGQGVMGTWWVVGTDGVKITTSGAPMTSSSS
ncbi:hypothetical protein ABLG96_03430 [Nakamurella sp. A5-74]|uniref:Lipoprotein with Yx(FWY)xxD motif n=1 Tax=Nakamurella sp. A5-74 TaxID=3158264 RepID=A0AAU8DT86_9ACTN